MGDLTSTVLGLFFCLGILIILLFFLYKKLNRETNGEYTIQQIVYKEGGVRDQVRNAATTVGTHLGIQLWPDSDEDDEEMQNVQVEEGQDEGDSSQQDNDTDGENEQDGDSEDGSTKEKEGDKSSLDSSEAGEQDRLMDNPEVRVEIEDRKEENQENAAKEQGSVEVSGGTGLLIDLKQFSGSAIWSEEDGGEGRSSDVTAL